MSRAAAAVAVILTLGAPGGLAGQADGPVFPRPVFMVGYVVNAPEQLVGGGAAFLPPGFGGWGIYADVKGVTDSPANESSYAASVTREEAESFGDAIQSERSAWRSFNVAVLRAFRDDVIVYVGGGASKETPFIEYYDATQERGRFGYYWVRDAEMEAWRANAMGGIYFRLMRNLAFQFGAELAPRGVTAGALLVF